MSHVLLVDRPQPFRKNGVGRYLLEIASAVDQMQDAPELRVFYLGRARAVCDWRQRIASPPAQWGVWLNDKAGVGWGLRRATASLVHYPTGDLHPQWDAGDTPRVLTLHGMGKYTVQPWYAEWQRTRAEQLRQRFAHGRHKLKHIIAVSHYVKQMAVAVLELAPAEITVVPNGVDFNRFYFEDDRAAVASYLAAHLKLTAPYWFYLGPCGPRKNVRRQLQTFAHLKQKLTLPHKFVIAGPAGTDARRHIHRWTQELGIGDDVIVLGEIRDDQRLRMLYNGAELFLFPSLYEGFGIPVIEAMACGTPVVTSNTHSLPEVSGNAAALVDEPTDVENLIHVVEGVLADANYRQQLRQRGLLHARAYSWENSARGHVAVYQRVLQEAGA